MMQILGETWLRHVQLRAIWHKRESASEAYSPVDGRNMTDHDDDKPMITTNKVNSVLFIPHAFVHKYLK